LGSIGEAPARILIEHQTTADMADGQPLPPLIENGRPWHLVRRTDGYSLWRRFQLFWDEPHQRAPR
jgi:hypothetical protein